VGGEAVLGLGVHLAGADLDLDPHLLVVDDRGVAASGSRCAWASR
jgi:hypothetical protein